jgi:hypothetical protein
MVMLIENAVGGEQYTSHDTTAVSHAGTVIAI